jgi:hypothetical protein
MYGIGNDPFGQYYQGQAFDYREMLVGRILSAENQLGVEQHSPAGNQLAGQDLGQLSGLFLSRLFQ